MSAAAAHSVVLASDFQPYGSTEHSLAIWNFPFHNVKRDWEGIILKNIKHHHLPSPLQHIETNWGEVGGQISDLGQRAGEVWWTKVAVDLTVRCCWEAAHTGNIWWADWAADGGKLQPTKHSCAVMREICTGCRPIIVDHHHGYHFFVGNIQLGKIASKSQTLHDVVVSMQNKTTLTSCNIL